jgi:hypothetical protein
MTSDEDNDSIDDALYDMGSFDAQEGAIEAAELGGDEPQVPKFSSAKFEALIAASVDVADLPPSLEERPSRTRGWVRWAIAAGGALAAGLLLWQLRAPAVVAPSGPVPAGTLRLGGTARTLGEAPAIRPYGPGDAFMLELSFEQAPPDVLQAAVVARDASGAETKLALDLRRRDAALVFEGEIASMLAPGVWTLSVDYGDLDACGTDDAALCRHAETTVEVLAP